MTATHVIWIVAIFTAGGLAAYAFADVPEHLAASREAAHDRGARSLEAQAGTPWFCYNEVLTRLTFRAYNVGDAPIDGRNVSIVVDGVVLTGFNMQVRGAWTYMWEPGDLAFFNLTTPVEPTKLVAYTPEGTAIHATKVVCPLLTRIVVEPAAVSMQIGETADFWARGYDQFDEPFDGSPYSFSTTAGTLTPLNASGTRLTAGTVSGTYTLAVNSGDIWRNVTVVIWPGPPASASVSPGVGAVPAGGSQTYVATFYDQYGNVNGTSVPTWSTDAGSITNGGVLTAQTTAQSGRSVTATSGAASGSAIVDVVANVPSTLELAPDPATVTAGATQAFAATVRDVYGNVNATSPITWSTTAGTISAAGVLTAQTTAQDGLSVTATTTGGVTDTATVDVVPGAPDSIVVTPDLLGIPAGSVQGYTATVYDQYGNVNATSIVSWTTDGGTIAQNGVLTAQTTAALGRTVTATSGSASGSATVDVWPAAPATATISPGIVGVAAGSVYGFDAHVYDQYGNENTTATIVWTTTAGSIAQNGVLTAQTTAQSGRSVTVTSGAASTSATVDVVASVPSSITLSPGIAGVTAGTTQAFTATVYDTYGNVNATAAVSWSTNAGSISAAGVLTAQTTAQGGRSVTATSGAASGSATVDVIAAAPATIVVSPDAMGVTVGTTLAYSATAYDQYGNVNATATISWSTNAGSISAAGVLTAQTTAATGRTVTATSGAASDSASVDVIAAAPSSLSVSPTSADVTVGATQTFAATVYDTYGNVNATAGVSWSTNAGSITSGGVLTAQTTAANGRSVTATTTGSVSGGATVNVLPGAPSTITVTPDAMGVTAGATQAYAATVYDSYGNVNGTATVSWSTNAGSITSGGVLTAQTTAANGRTVTATSGAASGSATVDVWPAAPATATIAPGIVGVAAGSVQGFTATLYDGYGNVNTSATVSWTTNAGTIAANGVLTAQTTAQSGRSVTATSGVASATATVNVVASAPSSITVTPGIVGLTAGTTQAFAATVYDAYGNVNATAAVSWSTNAGSITSGGVLTAQTTAQSGRSVTATSGAASGSATVDVIAAAPASVAITPSSASVTAGATQAFAATVYDQYGNVNATASVAWTTNAGSISAAGVLTAQTTAASGKTVTATTTGGVSQNAAVTIVPGPVDSITVTPSSAIVNTTLTRTFGATAYDQYGNVVTGTTFTWSATRGTITSGGLYTAPSTTGADTVTASASGKTGTASVSVQRAVHVDSITTYKSNVSATSFRKGTDTVEARVVVKDHLGNVVSGATVTVEFVRPDATVMATGTPTSTGAGVASAYYALPASASQGGWTARVASIAGTDLWYDAAANVATSAAFTVTT